MEASSNPVSDSKWQEISEEIKMMIKTAVKMLYEKGKMKHNQAKRYLSSGKHRIWACSVHTYISVISQVHAKKETFSFYFDCNNCV